MMWVWYFRAGLLYTTYDGSNPRTVHPSSFAMSSSKLQLFLILWKDWNYGLTHKNGSRFTWSAYPREYTKQLLWKAYGPAKQTFQPPSLTLPNLFATAHVAVSCSKYLSVETQKRLHKCWINAGNSQWKVILNLQIKQTYTYEWWEWLKLKLPITIPIFIHPENGLLVHCQ